MDRASIIAFEEVCKRCHLYTKHCGMLEYPSQCVDSGHFIDGYRKAEKDLGWHSVDESLPPMDEEVIVLVDVLAAGGLDAGFGRIAFGHIVDIKRRIDYDGWNIPGVRYWMPMPKIEK